ncbi:MAG: hypothetical protein IPO21_15155 [Bacteroidales bacterium]|nr:hypothetical protein [Bacteroidales bacterium]
MERVLYQQHRHFQHGSPYTQPDFSEANWVRYSSPDLVKVNLCIIPDKIAILSRTICGKYCNSLI